MGRQSGLSAHTVRRIGEVVDRIYVAAGTPDAIANIFAGIRTVIPCETAVYFPFDAATGLPATEHYLGYGGEHIGDAAQQYGSYYARLDPLKDRSLPRNVNRPLRNSDVLSRTKIIHSEFYSDFLRPLRIGHVMGCAVGAPGRPLGGIGLHRPMGSTDFEDKEKALFGLLAPHIGYALQSSVLRGQSAPALRQEEGSAERRYLHVWESDELAVVVFDMQLRPRRVSAEAAALLGEWHGFSAEDTRLTLSCLPASAQRLLVGLKRQWDGRNRADIPARPFARSACVKIGERHYLFTGSIVSPGGEQPLASASLLLTVERLPVRSRIVSCLSGHELTRREKEITGLLLQGLGNQAIAARLHITEQTVKDHLRSIYRKFNVNSRANLLVKLLWSRHFQ